jgi:hypothetical protein
VESLPGHDHFCERGRGPIREECHCHSRTYLKDPVVPVGVDPPWGLFGFQRAADDTRGREDRSA